MDKNDSGKITYEEFWDWIKKVLREPGKKPGTVTEDKFVDDQIRRVEDEWSRKFFEISKGKWYFHWKDIKKMIKREDAYEKFPLQK